MRIVVMIAGVLVILLGGLWLLQGLGLVVIPPVLCVAECAPLEGPSAVWAIVGLATVAAGVVAVYRALKRKRPSGD